jgi:hypothetical protein
MSGCTVTGGSSLTCTWSAVAGADLYQLQVVQPPPAGPGGGAVTVAARQVSEPSATLDVPAGPARVLVAACNGVGCGPFSAPTAINPAGPNPQAAGVATPIAGTVVAGPTTLFTWNRVAGDTGSNTTYRLFIQDLSRQSAALDVFTTNNFHAAFLKAEGASYAAQVIANPGLSSEAVGPASWFGVRGASASAPTIVFPANGSRIAQGSIQVGWSPVPGATLYECFVAVTGVSNATARAMTPGLVVQVPLRASGASSVGYSAIARACPAGSTCVAGSDTGWGPWSNAPGGPGGNSFTITP